MARVVGDSRTYPLSLLNAGGQAVGIELAIPSVTTILKALPKELSWWGYKMGLLEGKRLALDPTYTYPETDDEFYEAVKHLGREGLAQTPSNVLTTAGDRGTFVHDIAEQVFKDGVWPDKKLVPEKFHGYIHALKRWYDKHIDGKGYVTVQTEVPLFSISKYPYIYAGTCDLILKDVANDIYHVIDFKTNKKGVYESHLLQIAAYTYAARERGIVPQDATTLSTIVRIGGDGKYQTKSSSCTIEDFIAVYRVWAWLETMSGRETQTGKADALRAATEASMSSGGFPTTPAQTSVDTSLNTGSSSKKG